MITVDPGAVEFLFAPEDDVATAFLQGAAAEQTELCVLAYSFTLATLVGQLLANHKRGLLQYVLADLSQSKDGEDHAALVQVFTAGIPTLIGTAPSGNILHSKVMLGESQNLVFTGSYNFSQSAAVEDNAAQVFVDLVVWQAFRAHFQTAWQFVAQHEPQDQLKAALAAGGTT